MSFSLIWLPEVLKQAGLKVATIDGWENRGRADVGDIVGVLCHHTAGLPTGNMPSLNTLINGRSDLAGPLAQLGLGRDGTYFVIAAGKCNHAGAGIWKGFVNGNTNFIGIEAENTGLAKDFPWPAVQLEAYHRGVAAILKFIGRGFEFCAGHKEYALPKGRKPDPNLNMNEFRERVAVFMGPSAPAVNLIPAVEPAGQRRRTIRRGDSGPLVIEMQKKLQLKTDGVFGPETEAAVREMQRRNNLVPDGIVGPKTWMVIDHLP